LESSYLNFGSISEDFIGSLLGSWGVTVSAIKLDLWVYFPTQDTCLNIQKSHINYIKFELDSRGFTHRSRLKVEVYDPYSSGSSLGSSVPGFEKYEIFGYENGVKAF